jgi:DNA polymerase III epsilon subunit-like protein
MSKGMVTGDPYGPWMAHNLVVFDVETTGLDSVNDRIVEVGLARFENGLLVKRWGSIVYPEMSIPDEASAIHGITNLDVATAPLFIETISRILSISQNAQPVAYNASFDRSFWFNALKRLPLTELESVPLFNPEVRWLDPLVFVRHFDGLWGDGNKLTTATGRYSVNLESAHRATDDAVAAGRLLYALAEYRKIPPWTMTEILRRQQPLADKHEKEYQGWFNEKGISRRK